MRTYRLTNGRDIFEGRNIAERVFGNGGNDDLFGNGGDDFLFGGAGNDLLVGGTGDDTLDGGNGSDLLAGQSGNDSLDGAGGYDYATYFYAGAGAVVDLAAGTASDGEGGTDTLTSIEGAYGSQHADTLRGNGGTNELFGNAGDDILIGGGGQDLTVGNAGADTYRFANGDVSATLNRADLIGGFYRGEGDKIDLAGIDANSNVAGDQAFTFVRQSAFSGVAGELRFQSIQGETVLMADFDGDKTADAFIRIDTNQPLIASDLIL